MLIAGRNDKNIAPSFDRAERRRKPIRFRDLAAASHTAGAADDVEHFLRLAQRSLPSHPDRRHHTALQVACTAAETGQLDVVQPVLEEITDARPQALVRVFLAYCEAHRGTAPAPLPPAVGNILAESLRHAPSCLLACAGLARLYPASVAETFEIFSAAAGRPVP